MPTLPPPVIQQPRQRYNTTLQPTSTPLTPQERTYYLRLIKSSWHPGYGSDLYHCSNKSCNLPLFHHPSSSILMRGVPDPLGYRGNALVCSPTCYNAVQNLHLQRLRLLDVIYAHIHNMRVEAYLSTHGFLRPERAIQTVRKKRHRRKCYSLASRNVVLYDCRHPNLPYATRICTSLQCPSWANVDIHLPPTTPDDDLLLIFKCRRYRHYRYKRDYYHATPQQDCICTACTSYPYLVTLSMPTSLRQHAEGITLLQIPWRLVDDDYLRTLADGSPKEK